MPIFNKALLAIALSTAAILPAAANTPDDRTYARENMERYMPNAESSRNGLRGDLYLKQRQQSAPRWQTPMRQESPPGFGG